MMEVPKFAKSRSPNLVRRISSAESRPQNGNRGDCCAGEDLSYNTGAEPSRPGPGLRDSAHVRQARCVNGGGSCRGSSFDLGPQTRRSLAYFCKMDRVSTFRRWGWTITRPFLQAGWGSSNGWL